MNVFKGQDFFVYGAGVSGKSACRAIKHRGGRAKLYSDKCGSFTVPPEKNYSAAVISPGILPSHAVYGYCAERGIRVKGEAELGFELAECPVVGVTGTNGKTTVTGLIADMLGGTACGNIGYPITTAVDKEKHALVCELSSFQLRTAVISPAVAVITNIAADHLDYHGSFAEYCRCKCNIASNMKGGYLVIGEDVTVGALKTLDTSAQIVRCSTTARTDGAYIDGEYFMFSGERVCRVDYLRLKGKHNIKNALCAIAAAKCFGADNAAVLKALSTAKAAPHRIADIGEACGKRWIDDSKGTNIAATLAAADMTRGTVCLIAGGRGKGLDFDELFEALPDRVTDVIAMGESAQDIRDSAARTSAAANITVVDGLSAAVAAAAKTDAETVLLSPSCSSFDEFDNYAARGERFRAEVAALGRRK